MGPFSCGRYWCIHLEGSSYFKECGTNKYLEVNNRHGTAWVDTAGTYPKSRSCVANETVRARKHKWNMSKTDDGIAPRVVDERAMNEKHNTNDVQQMPLQQLCHHNFIIFST